MTLAEYDEKIENLKTIRDNSVGLDRINLTSVIDNLVTARTENLTNELGVLSVSFTETDVADLKVIADKFEEGNIATEYINELIRIATEIGKKLVHLVV